MAPKHDIDVYEFTGDERHSSIQLGLLAKQLAAPKPKDALVKLLKACGKRQAHAGASAVFLHPQWSLWPALAGDAIVKQPAKAVLMQEVGTVLEAAEQGTSHEGLAGLAKALGCKSLLEHKDKVWEWTPRIGAWLPPFHKHV